ncbi:2-dehydro-3-deoxygalactonokinase [Brevundimonas aurifodinae]|uniref:2-dehydro-3-deoxygalactonokinase n=1 Tax=Brevundimonas aurifodinae TaxID=1508312 RepID=A0ABV1NNC0_9CAUL
MTEPVLIGLDWGTTNLRAYLLGTDGAVIESRSDPRGAGALTSSDYPAVLQDAVGDWMAAGLPALICGMAGSRAGWREAPYQPCPASLEQVASQLTKPVARSGIWIVPGVAWAPGGVLLDVMRGEETQVFGVGDLGSRTTIIAPGTHSKWIVVEGGDIQTLKTYPTGELFAAIQTSPLFGAALSSGYSKGSPFLKGAERGLVDPAVTSTLFSVRIERLAERLSDASAAEYLSGLLIGSEVALASATFENQKDDVIVVGQSGLADLYSLVLYHAGYAKSRQVDAESATARGLWRIWKAEP